MAEPTRSGNSESPTYGISVSLSVVDGIVEITYLGENSDYKDEIRFNSTGRTDE